MKENFRKWVESNPRVHCKEPYIKKNKPEHYSNIVKYSIDNNIEELRFTIKMWLYCHDVVSEPICGCGSPLKYVSFIEGYREFCQNKCDVRKKAISERVKATNQIKYGGNSPMCSEGVRQKSKESVFNKYGVNSVSELEWVKEARKHTNLERYGAENPLLSEEIQEKIKQTNLERYGAENPFQSEEIKEKIKETNKEKYGFEYAAQVPEIKEKMVETHLKRYGVKHAMMLDETQEKKHKTNMERYGVEHVSQNKDIKEKISQNKTINGFDRMVEKFDDEILFVSGDIVTAICGICHKEYEILRSTMNVRHNNDVMVCTNCNPIKSVESEPEREIERFLSEYDIELISNSRSIIPPKELDIYIPSKNIAIEFNGLYWHNETFIPNNYHLDKTLECKKQDIQLIHIYQDEWIYKQDIVKSRLLNILGKIPNKIYARKTEIKEVSSKDARTFLDTNHIQGHVNSRVKLGLYYDNELVSLMTFGGLRKNMGSVATEGHYELLRFCNKLDTSVIGGASKLFKHFLKHYNPNNVISYADRRWSQGNLYKQLGFNHVHNSDPSYFYVIGDTRENRFKYRKDILVKEGFDPNKTEKEIMFERKIYRIYDCGSMKFEYIIK